MSDADDGREGAQGLPNYIKAKPMTANPTADAAKLLPCPFCGASDGIYTEAQAPWHYIARCSNCNAGHCERTEDEVIAKWNTRPQPVPPEGEPDLRQFIKIKSCVVEGEPDARNVFLEIGNQSFCVTSYACENEEETKWFADRLFDALTNLIGHAARQQQKF